ncbi:MAG: DUF1926 domain-containing protein [Treponema sp.]|nr:DUF1926 domain-containing protein [Treponema sp.]
MNSIYVCFSIKSVSYSLESSKILEEDYQTVYKPIVKFLYNNPSFEFSLSFSGLQLSYFKNRKKELITILKEMIERKQLEVLGGGYYGPILPLIFPVDRNGQIDMLSAELRQTLGKRPRGITLFADCWDASLVNNLQTCGVEYTFLDSQIIGSDKQKFLPIIMTDLGKSVEIFPSYENLAPEKDESAKDFITKIVKAVEKVEKKDKYLQMQPSRVVTINLSHSTMKELNSVKWFEKLASYLKENTDTRIIFSTPDNYRKINTTKIPGYISCGMNHRIAEGTELSIFGSKGKELKALNAYDFMQIYNPSHSLYNRIMYVSMLVNQSKVDKMRKKAAREKLWEAQNGLGLLCTNKSIFNNSKYRQKAFKNLMDAEKILREGSAFKETITAFDYDGDGLFEYVCRMQNYFAYISLIGGSILDLEPIKNSGNYADNLNRIIEWDGQEDDYGRGIFVDFLFSNEQFDSYISGEVPKEGVFSKIHYTEVKFNTKKREILLSASAMFMPTKQEVQLTKKYIINSDGMNVQYILKNKSNKTLRAKFAVESNFNNVNFDKEKLSYFIVEVLNKSERMVLDPEVSTQKLNKKNKLNNVDFARIADLENGLSFAYEPNEICSYYYNPITFKRPTTNYSKENIGMTAVSTLIWDVEIESEKETEKNINFTISSIKKRGVEKK